VSEQPREEEMHEEPCDDEEICEPVKDQPSSLELFSEKIIDKQQKHTGPEQRSGVQCYRSEREIAVDGTCDEK
jgi:hypothetical protein